MMSRLVLIPLFLFLFVSCSAPRDSVFVPGANDFAIQAEDKSLTLRESIGAADLAGILGQPITETVEHLRGDGFTGSRLKKVRYEGLEMELFSPEDDGDTFWIMTMVVSTAKYPTSRGVRIGSSVRQMDKANPGIRLANDGRSLPMNGAYEAEDGRESNRIVFEVENGIVTQIRIFHLIP